MAAGQPSSNVYNFSISHYIPQTYLWWAVMPEKVGYTLEYREILRSEAGHIQSTERGELCNWMLIRFPENQGYLNPKILIELHALS